LMGDMLQGGGNRWRGMLFGMTARLPWESSGPRPVWKVWDEFGIGQARMLGWWEKECPVRTGREDVLAGNLWFVMRVCPHCTYHGRSDGPSVYCVLSTHLAGKGEPQYFARRFRQNVGISAFNWALPVIGGAIALRPLHDRTYGLVMLAVFVFIAFLLVPMAAKPNCERCLNREACPYGTKVT